MDSKNLDRSGPQEILSVFTNTQSVVNHVLLKEQTISILEYARGLDDSPVESCRSSSAAISRAPALDSGNAGRTAAA